MQIDPKNPKFGNSVGTCENLPFCCLLCGHHIVLHGHVAVLRDVVKETWRHEIKYFECTSLCWSVRWYWGCHIMFWT